MAEFFVAGVIGHPIRHSLSPEIFRFLASRLPTKNSAEILYGAYDIPPAKLKESLKSFSQNEFFLGVNVTLPHKERALRLCQKLSSEARTVGAVNVIRMNRGQRMGCNTDVFGILECFREQGIRVRAKRAVIFGAGGAAAAATYALAKSSAREVIFVNRNAKRAQILCQRFAKIFPRTQFSVKKVDELPMDVAVYINATPVGMRGFPRTRLLPKKLNPKAWAFDLIYRPADTIFLKSARKSGLKTLGGLDMLVWQALATWELWTGKISQKTRIKNELKIHLNGSLK